MQSAPGCLLMARIGSMPWMPSNNDPLQACLACRPAWRAAPGVLAAACSGKVQACWAYLAGAGQLFLDCSPACLRHHHLAAICAGCQILRQEDPIPAKRHSVLSVAVAKVNIKPAPSIHLCVKACTVSTCVAQWPRPQ